MNLSCDPRKLDPTRASLHRQMERVGVGVGVGGRVCDHFLCSAASQELEMAAVSDSFVFFKSRRQITLRCQLAEGGGSAGGSGGAKPS